MDAVDLTEYTWPECTSCRARLREYELDRRICRRCEARTLDRLTSLAGLFAELNTTGALLRRAGASRSGSPDPSVAAAPVLLGALCLVGPGGVATRLQAIEDSWRGALGRRRIIPQDAVRVFAPWRTHPASAVPGHLAFLRFNLDWAARSYESVNDDVEEIRALHRECTTALDPSPRPRPVKVGLCPATLAHGARCGTQLTVRPPASVIRCTGCGMTWDGRSAWARLQTAQARLADLDAAAAA